jgi:hypothetical protein
MGDQRDQEREREERGRAGERRRTSARAAISHYGD